MRKFLLMAGLICFAGGTVATTTGCSKEQRAKVKEKAKSAADKAKAGAKKMAAKAKSGAKKMAAGAKKMGAKAAAGAKKMGAKAAAGAKKIGAKAAAVAVAGAAATKAAMTKKKWLCICQLKADADGSQTGQWEGQVLGLTRQGVEKGTAANGACEAATASHGVNCKSCSCRPDDGSKPKGITKKAG
ncbi:MAG: hypothetical protein CMH52_12345 [Myxococcales bacterium]|nr:hypothetical protein [Myxococcales bacterium]|tara:strand:- start:1248 stop:1808 length:561 start_codon:yes stop_codon:yes gene_type:complete